MRIRILTENTVYKRGLLGEHGLSVLVEEHGKKFLFDSGQSSVYLKNAFFLKEDLGFLDGIILSHGHYDHCGGLRYFPGGGELLPIYVREKAFEDKRHYNKKTKEYQPVRAGIHPEQWKGEIVYTGKRHEICENFILLGGIEQAVDFESGPEGFYIGEGLRPDKMEDEQILAVRTAKGLCLFMGCSHTGVISCLSRVRKEFPKEPIRGILAGMHLSHSPMEKIDATVTELRKIPFDYLIPVHCTGLRAIGRMKEAFGERCILAETGKEITL